VGQEHLVVRPAAERFTPQYHGDAPEQSDLTLGVCSLAAHFNRRADCGHARTAVTGPVRLEPGLVLQPDVLVVPAGELQNRSDVVHRLLVAVETLSPGSARHDRVTKRPHYQRTRVPEYWIIDDRSQTVERWRPDDERPELLGETLVWAPSGASEPFVLDLRAFFAEVVPAGEE
jgi:Uma2 family endonuclease